MRTAAVNPSIDHLLRADSKIAGGLFRLVGPDGLDTPLCFHSAKVTLLLLGSRHRIITCLFLSVRSATSGIGSLNCPTLPLAPPPLPIVPPLALLYRD
jgi:hypothetical protein